MKNAAWFAGVALVAGLAVADVKYVDDFDLASTACGMGRKTQARRSFDGNPLRLGDRTFERGFGTHAEGAVAFALDGKSLALKAQTLLGEAESPLLDRFRRAFFRLVHGVPPFLTRQRAAWRNSALLYRGAL